MIPLLLQPIATIDGALLGRLSRNLAHLLRAPVMISDDVLDPYPAFDLGRNQHNSTGLLLQLLDRCASFDGKVLGITSLDLFVPVLTYVFGEAQLDGKAAVISTYRLDERLYGFPANQSLYELRMVKEAMHEIGHTLGLYHCHDYRCVMHSSTAVEEIDLKGENYCPACEGKALR